jgi:hypothetical protein
MQIDATLTPREEDAHDVCSSTQRYESKALPRETSTIYSLRLSGRDNIQTTDARIARDYFAALAKAAQELVDAADEAILAEPLDLPVAVAS